VLADAFDRFLFDLDGVVYIDGVPLPGAAASIARLRRGGKSVRFLTNDPRPTRTMIVAQLGACGIVTEIDEVISAGWATGRWLTARNLQTAHVVGSEGLRDELRAAGIIVDGHTQPDAVVTGCDEGITYGDLAVATAYVQRGASFVATNGDGSFPTQDGRSPATGAIVAALEKATGRLATVIGKPSADIFDAALSGADAGRRTVMVGDSLEADILGAHRAGLPAVLVGQSDVRLPQPRDPRHPDAVIADLTGLFDPRVRLRDWSPADLPWPDTVAAAVAAVVFDDAGRVLLGLRADKGLWGIPSGHVEPGESVVDAVRREVREEAGLDVAVESLIGIYSDPESQTFVYPSGRITHFITNCFRCRITGGDLRPDGTETLAVRFFSCDDLPDALLPMHPRWLADALANEVRPFVR
jgi:HAD superfamily hydrolase (TIGR01450 family)